MSILVKGKTVIPLLPKMFNTIIGVDKRGTWWMAGYDRYGNELYTKNHNAGAIETGARYNPQSRQ
jgi:hypothetical protein